MGGQNGCGEGKVPPGYNSLEGEKYIICHCTCPKKRLDLPRKT